MSNQKTSTGVSHWIALIMVTSISAPLAGMNLFTQPTCTGLGPITEHQVGLVENLIFTTDQEAASCSVICS